MYQFPYFVTAGRDDTEGLHHVELMYDPIHFNAVTCNQDYIFMADSAPGGGVHINTWSGQHTQSLSHAQLRLQDHDWIWATHCDSKILQLAIGDYGSKTVHSLPIYEVIFKHRWLHTRNI